LYARFGGNSFFGVLRELFLKNPREIKDYSKGGSAKKWGSTPLLLGKMELQPKV